MNNPYTLNTSKHSTHNVIAEKIGTNHSVLDIGCNTGYIESISDQSNKFYGLDYLPDAVKKAKKNYVDAITYDLNNLKSLPWKKKFDVLVFADVLEHLINAEECLGYFINNYLAKNGLVIISLPNIANWQIRLKLILGKFDYTDSGIMDRTHVYLYTHKSARELVNNANLSIKQELAGASFFGPVIKLMPFTKTLLATDIILINEK